jgi:hypothetical protein
MVGCLSKSAEVMQIISILMKAPALAATMEQFTKEMIKVTFVCALIISCIRGSKIFGFVASKAIFGT